MPFLIRVALYTFAKVLDASTSSYGNTAHHKKPSCRGIKQFTCTIAGAPWYLSGQESSSIQISPRKKLEKHGTSHKQEMGEVSVMLVEREKGYLELVPKQLEGS